MTIRAILPASDYLYLSRFTSTDQTRHDLGGVSIENGPVMVATDCLRLGALRLKAKEGFHTGASFILSASKELRRACNLTKREQAWLICREDRVDIMAFARNVNVDADTLQDYTGAAACSFPASVCYIDGTFPDWRRVFPRVSAGSREFLSSGNMAYSGYNADHLADFRSADNVTVSFDGNGSSAAIITNSDPRFIGLLMPISSGLAPAAILDRMRTVTGHAPPAEQSDVA